MKDDKRDIERRVFSAEVRADGDGSEIVGYAAVFDSESEDLGGFVEVIEPGAFRDVLGDDVRALFNHDANFVLGRNRADTLALAETKRGLESRIKPPATQWADDLMVSMRRGDVDQMSFGFTVAEDVWEKRADGIVQRTISKFARLFDVSVVTFPAYPQTSVQARSAARSVASGEWPVDSGLLAEEAGRAAGESGEERGDGRPEDRLAHLRRWIEIKKREI
jgi:HK97 family phage prohead protease